jgi:hypothetical protein
MKAGFIAKKCSFGAVIGQSQNIMPRSQGFNNQGIRGVFMWLFIYKMQFAMHWALAISPSCLSRREARGAMQPPKAKL